MSCGGPSSRARLVHPPRSKPPPDACRYARQWRSPAPSSSPLSVSRSWERRSSPSATPATAATTPAPGGEDPPIRRRRLLSPRRRPARSRCSPRRSARTRSRAPASTARLVLPLGRQRNAISVSGAFESAGPKEMPKADVQVSVDVPGFDGNGGFVTTGDRAWFTRGNVGYAVPAVGLERRSSRAARRARRPPTRPRSST